MVCCISVMASVRSCPLSTDIDVIENRGNSPTQAPRHVDSLWVDSLWVDYLFDSAALDGLCLGVACCMSATIWARWGLTGVDSAASYGASQRF